jgi:serine/threonine protein kinase
MKLLILWERKLPFLNPRGAFSEVKTGINKQTGEKFAIKIVDRSKCKGKEDMIETEVQILTQIDHPNIVKLYEKYEFEGKIYLVMEL